MVTTKIAIISQDIVSNPALKGLSFSHTARPYDERRTIRALIITFSISQVSAKIVNGCK